MSGRPKHIYSIWNKMRAEVASTSTECVRRARLRVLVDDVKDCYTALGIVHHLWQPIRGEFDDYISHPKGNNLPLAAHRGGRAETAARWRCRSAPTTCTACRAGRGGALALQGGRRARSVRRRRCDYDDKIAWLRQVLSWRDEIADSGVGGAVQARRAGRHHLRADAAGQGDRPAGRRHAGGFRLSPAHRPRPPLPRRQGQRPAWCRWTRLWTTASAWRSSPPRQGGPSRDWLNPAQGPRKLPPEPEIQTRKSRAGDSRILVVGVDKLMTQTGTLLQTDAAGCHHRLRHPRQGHLHPSRRRA
jgi:GTP pyrophosphokinase